MNLKMLLPILLLVLAMPVHADQLRQGSISFQAAREGSVWVGQEVELQLELWTDGFSFGNQLFVLPEVKGAYLLQPDSTTVKLNEYRGGIQWQGLSYSLLLYPQREGRLEVPAFNVQFTASAGLGTEPASFNFRTPTLFIEARLPPGAEPGSLLVATTSFDLDSAWSQSASDEGTVELKVGDAITLTVNRRADDVPGMVFEPLPDFERPDYGLDGLGVYTDAPLVNDRVNRGSLTGVRSDKVTFICEREGIYDIPELRFQWWDPEQEVMSEQTVPSLSLVVKANPAYAASSKSSASSGTGRFENFSVWTWVIALLVLALSLFPLRKGWRLLKAYMAGKRAEHEAGEAWAFRQVKTVCGSGTASEAYNAITLWLSRLEKGSNSLTLMDLAVGSGSEELVAEARVLQECVAAGSAAKWTGRKLAQLLVDYRDHADKTAKTANGLHALNPPGPT